MTDQFSREYIDFILSDEAKGLQDHVAIRFGTHVLSSALGGERIAVVTGAENDPDAACDFYGVFEGSARSTDFDGSEIMVLPTLWDLVRIIEGKWPIIDIHVYPDDEQLWTHILATAECVEWAPDDYGPMGCSLCGDSLYRQENGTYTYRPRPKKAEDYDTWDSNNLPICPHCGEVEESDIMLAAAKLAVRAIEGTR